MNGGPAGDPGAAGAGSVEALFDQARAGLEVYDTNFRVLRANPAVLRMRDRTAAAVIGADVRDLDRGFPVSPVIEEVLRTGSTVEDRRMTAHPRSDAGQRREYVVTGYPLRDGDRTTGAASMVHDVTEQLRERAGLELLSTARAHIGSHLDALRTAQELADTAVPGFADSVAVDVVESVLSGDAPIGPVSGRLPMRRAAFQSHDGAYGAYPVGSASDYAFPTPYTQALSDLRPRLVASVAPYGQWLAQDQPRAEFIARTGVHSFIAAPLTVHGLVLGMATFYRDGARPEPFDEADLSLATQIAGVTALCVDNARRFTREHTVATALQRSLLPRTPPRVAAVRSAQCYLPGEYGAHWFDVLPLSSCRVGLVLGYVPGEDLWASATMGRLRTAASTLASMDLPPDELMAHLDDVSQSLGREQEADPGSRHRGRPPFTASCLYLTYDPVSRRCALASAAHDGPLLADPEGTVSRLEVPRGAPLGQGTPYDMRTVDVAVGSLLCLYSDSVAGRYPAEADKRLSRLRDVLADPSATPEEVCDSATYKLLRGASREGMALLTARLNRLDPHHVASWTFPAEAVSVREARRAAHHQLAEWGLEEHAPTTDLVVSELATNVLSHATGPIRLRLILDRTLTVEVSDEADTAPHLRHARLQDEGGRGLFLIASFTRHWGTRYEENGKTIWAEQSLTDI
ncbi:SpoIIE family protein phosphatase [Streptomyces sp. AcH 505]|uniref:SpoIIE family protein phosphatase n=1 Tax=Streptomyces sp. AcH 505 TaxID=352211 RepID=UPI0005AB4089